MRYCNVNQVWDGDSLIDVSQCQSIKLVNILNNIRSISDNANLDELNDIMIITNDIINLTVGPIFPLDLQNTNNILNAVVK